MSPIVILIISIVLVVAGILVCKLHAFLALLLAALVAAFLTSGEALDTYALDEAETEFESLFGQRPGMKKLKPNMTSPRLNSLINTKPNSSNGLPCRESPMALVPRVGKSASSSRWRRSSENACSTADLPTESCEQS